MSCGGWSPCRRLHDLSPVGRRATMRVGRGLFRTCQCRSPSSASSHVVPRTGVAHAEPFGYPEGEADALGDGEAVDPDALLASSFALEIAARAASISLWYVARSPALSAVSAAAK